MRAYLSLATLFGIVNLYYPMIGNIRFIESLSLGFYLYLVIRQHPGKWINLGSFYALGQLFVSLANMGLSREILKGNSGGMYDYIIPEFIEQGLTIHFLGVHLFLLGFHLVKPSLVVIQSGMKKPRYCLIFALSILLVANRYFWGITPPGSLNAILNITPIAAVLYLSRKGYQLGDARIKRYAILSMGFQVVIAFLYAMLRTHMVIPIIAFFLGTFLAKKRVSYFLTPRFYPFYAGFALFVTFFFAFGAIRGTTKGSDRLSSLTQAKEEFSETNMSSEHSPLHRMADLAQITNVIDMKKSNNFSQGETIAILGVAFIPRVIWPSKPTIALGVWFALKIGKALETESGWYNTSINMTIPGHLWLEFGWSGLIIGMFVIGAYFHFLWAACGALKVPDNFIGTVFGGYLLIGALMGFGADLQIIITTIALFVILAVISAGMRLVSS